MRSERARHNKIIFSGTVGAGKSTAIAALSDIPPVATEAVATDETSQLKKTTTVAMDYGVLNLPDGEKVMLYGTPGQERFNFMWEILSEGALGLVILVDNSRPDPLADLHTYLDGFAGVLAGVPCTIGVGRLDSHPQPDLDHYAEALAGRDALYPVLDVDVRRREDVLLLIDTLLAQIEANALGAMQ